MNCKKEKNGEIEILRLVFCFAVMLCHLSSNFGMLQFKRGTFAVEFFFLVSGFFMARTAERTETVSFDDTIGFLSRKISTFLPYYIGAVLIHLVVFRLIICHTSLHNLLTGIIKLIPEFIFLQMGGFATESIINVPAVWYLSAMLLSMLILYPFAVKFKKSYGVVFLILAIFGIGYLVRKHNGYIVVFRTTDCGLLYDGMLRGLCETALGAVCYKFSEYIYEKTCRSKVLLTIAKYIGYLICVAYVFSSISNKYEPVVLIIMTCSFVLTVSDVTYNIPCNRFTSFCGRLSLPLYLFHSVVLRCIASICGAEKLSATQTLVVVLIIMVMSLAFKYLCDLVMKPYKIEANDIQAKKTENKICLGYLIISALILVLTPVADYVIETNAPFLALSNSTSYSDKSSTVRCYTDSTISEEFYVKRDSVISTISFYTITWKKEFDDSQTLKIVIKDKDTSDELYSVTKKMSEFTDARVYQLSLDKTVEVSGDTRCVIEFIPTTSEKQEYMALMMTKKSDNLGKAYINGKETDEHIAMQITCS